MARTMKVDLPPFTLIGATTRPGLLSQPLHGRFGITLRLDFYDVAALAQIVDRSARILVDPRSRPRPPARSARAAAARPRIANRLLRRLRDFAEVAGKDAIDLETARAGAGPPRGRRARVRRARPPHPRDDHREVRRRPRRRRRDRRVARRGPRHARGPLRALPAPGRLPAAHAARPGRLARGVPASRDRRRRDAMESCSEVAARPCMKRGLLVYNPTAGQRDRRARDERADRPAAGERGLELVNVPTSGPGRRDGDRAQRSCRAASTSSPSAAATARSRRPRAGWPGSDVPLAVLPGGTSNVLAVELGIPLDFDCAPRISCSQDGVPRDPVRATPTAGPSCSGRASGSTRGSWAR